MTRKRAATVEVPAPTGGRGTPMSARHTALSVHLDSGHIVVFEDNDSIPFGTRIRVVDDRWLYPRHLLEPLGRRAVAMQRHCGGRLDSGGVVFGESADQEVALVAIPHLHAESRTHRRTLAVMYRRLLGAAEQRAAAVAS